MADAASPLAGTVKPYHRHFFACTGRSEWPAKIEDDPGLLGRMARDMTALAREVPTPPRLGAAGDPTPGPGLDLLVFPDALRYRGVTDATWPAVLSEHARGGRPASSLHPEPVLGTHLFVCIHAARDERCGRCGPPVLDALRRALAERGLRDVHVHATSHVGGHEWAANVIVYPAGVWYGTVRPDVVPHLVDELARGRVIEPLLRGRMAPSLA